MLFKGQVVDEDYKAVAAVFDARDHAAQVAELVLVNLDHAQAAVEVVVDKGLDAGGFAGPAVAVEQHVVRAAPGDEGLGVGDELALLLRVSDEAGQGDVFDVVSDFFL